MRSKWEHKIARELSKRGVKFKYEEWTYEYLAAPDPRSRFRCRECDSTDVSRVAQYTPDFFINGEDCIIEAKGRFTAADRRKMLQVKEQWPDLNIKMLFMTDNKIHKKSETRYSGWCEKHGLDYHVGLDFPEDWYNA